MKLKNVAQQRLSSDLIANRKSSPNYSSLSKTSRHSNLWRGVLSVLIRKFEMSNPMPTRENANCEKTTSNITYYHSERSMVYLRYPWGEMKPAGGLHPKWSPPAGFIFANFQPCNTGCSRPFGAILPALLLFSMTSRLALLVWFGQIGHW